MKGFISVIGKVVTGHDPTRIRLWQTGTEPYVKLVLQLSGSKRTGSPRTTQWTVTLRQNIWPAVRIAVGRYHINFAIVITGDHIIVVVIGIRIEKRIELLKNIQTTCCPSPLSGTSQRRQQNRRQNCNDRNDDKQFDQGKWVCGGQGKLFFTRKKVFPLPRTPSPFQKKRGICWGYFQALKMDNRPLK